jgi:DNA-directed RNA polymerase specialized sigma24 family protein
VVAPPPDVFELDPELASALRSLSPLDREALLLIAWEDLTPSQAARAPDQPGGVSRPPAAGAPTPSRGA